MGKLASPACRAIGGFLCLGDETGDKTLLPTCREWRNSYGFLIGRWSRELDSISR